MWNFLKSQTNKTGSRKVVARGWGLGRQVGEKGTNFQLQDE